MTQCMDDKKPEERARGMAAGLALLKGCDFVIAGVKYGITEGMDREIHTANMLGIAVIDANQIKRHLEYEEKRQERVASDYAKLHKCKHCYERRLCSLMGHAKTGETTGKGVFTIVEVKAGQGASAGWGRLKSGAGWISLDYATRLA